MRDKVWLPCGRSVDDLTFAKQMLYDRDIESPSKFCFVVPNVLPVDKLRTSTRNLEGRLTHQRSRLRYPHEEAGAAYRWWLQFCDAQAAKISAMCTTCRSIREELSSIVVRSGKGRRSENNAKTRRRNELLEQISSHECSDREAGRLDIPDTYSRVLAKLCSQVQCAPAQDQSIEQSGNQLGQAHRPANGQSDSESDEEGYRVLTDGMDRTIPYSRAPVAYKKRPQRIQKGMFVAMEPLETAEDDPLRDHPFWLVRVHRLTKRHVWLWYYGPKFLGSYKPLLRADGSDYVEKFEIDNLTFFHWNIQLVSKSRLGGKISKNDLVVLSRDVNLPWALDKHVGVQRKQQQKSHGNTSKSSKRRVREAEASTNTRSKKKKKKGNQ